MTALVPATDAAISQAVQELREGGLVVFPTDTVYGIACLEDLPHAVDRLFTAKQRPPEKKVARLVADLDQVIAHGGLVDTRARRLAEHFWPGPLTLVLPHVREGTVAYRVPDHPVALKLLRALDCPLLVTSANRSGEPDALTAQDAEAVLPATVSLILDGGPCPLKVASSILQLSADSIELLREGGLGLHEIEDALG
jgi:L-threonylcarbamoyladenylate synthase